MCTCEFKICVDLDVDLSDLDADISDPDTDLDADLSDPGLILMQIYRIQALSWVLCAQHPLLYLEDRAGGHPDAHGQRLPPAIVSVYPDGSIDLVINLLGADAAAKLGVGLLGPGVFCRERLQCRKLDGSTSKPRAHTPHMEPLRTPALS